MDTKIATACPACKASYSVPAASVGRQARCKCGTSFTIAAPAPEVPLTPLEVTVDIKKGTSGLGIASLVIGLLAIPSSWVPLVGMLTVPLAAIGLLVGILGAIGAVISRRSRLSMPIAGIVLCGLAIALAVGSLGAAAGAIAAVDRNADNAAAAGMAAAQAYRSSIEITDLDARRFDGLGGRSPGVRFGLTNNGDRDVRSVTVTVYFRGGDGRTIAEKSFTPTMPLLRPGYRWQLEEGRFWSVDHLPDDWRDGEAAAEVTSISFAPAQ